MNTEYKTAQHTPGPLPLKVTGPHEENDGGESYTVVTAQGNFYAKTYSRLDACAIAAAPDLLAALNALVSMYERGYVRPASENCGNGFLMGINDARAAILRATTGGK